MPDSKVDMPTDAGSPAGEKRDHKAVIKNVDMSEEMQQECVDIASAALEKYNLEKDIAAQVKKELDKRHGPTWHVVVGRHFGSYVTHGLSTLSIAAVDTPLKAFYVRRNQTLHLFLPWLYRCLDLEIID